MKSKPLKALAERLASWRRIVREMRSLVIDIAGLAIVIASLYADLIERVGTI